ncbi:MAG: CRTAC1 family protein [Pseudomonadota bacterium]
MSRTCRLCAVVLPALLAACGEPPAEPEASVADAAPAPVTRPLFVDAADEAGLAFEHFAGVSGRFYFPEIMGSGVALADFDGDGDLDVYAVQGRMIDREQPAAEALLPFPDGQGDGGRLFLNQLDGGTLRFVDATEGSGLNAGLERHGYDMGVAVGDVDGDGDADLLVTSFGPNRLYINNGNGRFTDVSAESGVNDEGWGTSAAFLDYDRDGDLDLFVTNYVTFGVANNKQCKGAGGATDYCDPLSYAAAGDRLYRNDGDGGNSGTPRFTDVTASAGIATAFGSGLGVTTADFDGDGWPDVYVANDKRANQLWINQRDGTFAETALMSGAAYNADGVAEASMGLTAGDFDGDGDEDLFMTHLNGQTNTLYRNDGGGSFTDVTDRLGLGASSLKYTGFGSAWFDYDNDGELDLMIVNGAVLAEDSQTATLAYPYRQRNQLFRGAGGGRFEDVSRQAGAAFDVEAVGRGAAFGDVDNDGDVDVLVSNNSGPLRLLLNTEGNAAHWLSVTLVGAPHAVGARAAVTTADGATRWRRVHTDGSYLCASDDRLHFGLGDAAEPVDLTVNWPSGAVESFAGLAVDTGHRLVEGAGAPVDGGAGAAGD